MERATNPTGVGPGARDEAVLAAVLSLGLLSIAALGSASCSREPVVPTDAIVSIDGEEIPHDEFADYLRAQVDEDELSLDAAALSALFDQFLDGELLARLAIERGLVDGEVDAGRALAFLLRDVRYEPTRAEAEAYYRAHLADFERAERVHLRQILVDDPELAAQAREAVLEEGFEAAAARFSQGPTAHLGGEHGVLARDDLPAQFADLVFELEPGETSRVVESDYGFQIFQVVERHAPRRVPFAEAEPRVRRELIRRHLDEQAASLRAEALERYNVTLFRPNLPFDYQGSHGQTDDVR